MPEIKEVTTPEQSAVDEWEREILKPVLEKKPERKRSFQGVSLEPVDRLYTPASVRNVDFENDISDWWRLYFSCAKFPGTGA